MSFIDKVVLPIWNAWADFVQPDCQFIIDTLQANRDWQNTVGKAHEMTKASSEQSEQSTMHA